MEIERRGETEKRRGTERVRRGSDHAALQEGPASRGLPRYDELRHPLLHEGLIASCCGLGSFAKL